MEVWDEAAFTDNTVLRSLYKICLLKRDATGLCRRQKNMLNAVCFWDPHWVAMRCCKNAVNFLKKKKAELKLRNDRKVGRCQFHTNNSTKLKYYTIRSLQEISLSVKTNKPLEFISSTQAQRITKETNHKQKIKNKKSRSDHPLS